MVYVFGARGCQLLLLLAISSLFFVSNSKSTNPHSRHSCFVDVKKDLNYDLVDNWPEQASEFTYEGKKLLVGQITGVDIEPGNQQVLLLHRADRQWDADTFDLTNKVKEEYERPIEHNTLLWLDRKSGQVLKVGGKDMFYMPHGITMDAAGFMWITDVGSHQVYKISEKIGIVMALGRKFQPGNKEYQFCKPTDVAVMPNGDFFVSDGYCNSRVVKFDKEGKLLAMISPTNHQNIASLPGPKYMMIVHSLAVDSDRERLFVADRENGRVLIFSTSNGKLTGEIKSPQGAVYAVAFNKNQGGVVHFVTGPSDDVTGPLLGYTFSFIGNKIVSSWAPKGGFHLPHDLAVTEDNLDLVAAEIYPPPYKVWKFTQQQNRFKRVLKALLTLQKRIS